MSCPTGADRSRFATCEIDADADEWVGARTALERRLAAGLGAEAGRRLVAFLAEHQPQR